MRWSIWILTLLVVGLVAGCGDDDAVDDGDGGPDASADTDGDTDVDSDGDTDTDTDADPDAGADAGIDDRVFGVTVDDPWVADAPDCDLNDKLDGLVGAGGRNARATRGIPKLFCGSVKTREENVKAAAARLHSRTPTGSHSLKSTTSSSSQKAALTPSRMRSPFAPTATGPPILPVTKWNVV